MDSIEPKQPKVEEGKKYTFIEISSSMAMSFSRQVKCILTQPKTAFTQKGHSFVYSPDFTKNIMVFEGWNIPIKTDFDLMQEKKATTFRGNALFNLVGEPDFIRNYIDANQLNPNFDNGIILVYEHANSLDVKPIILYPEKAKETAWRHAVLERELQEAGLS